MYWYWWEVVIDHPICWVSHPVQCWELCLPGLLEFLLSAKLTNYKWTHSVLCPKWSKWCYLEVVLYCLACDMILYPWEMSEPGERRENTQKLIQCAYNYKSWEKGPCTIGLKKIWTQDQGGHEFPPPHFLASCFCCFSFQTKFCKISYVRDLLICDLQIEECLCNLNFLYNFVPASWGTTYM